MKKMRTPGDLLSLKSLSPSKLHLNWRNSKMFLTRSSPFSKKVRNTAMLKISKMPTRNLWLPQLSPRSSPPSPITFSGILRSHKLKLKCFKRIDTIHSEEKSSITSSKCVSPNATSMANTRRRIEMTPSQFTRDIEALFEIYLNANISIEI